MPQAPLGALPNKLGILPGAPLSPPPPSGTLPHLCGGHHPAPPPLSLCQHPPFFSQRSLLAISAVSVNHLAGCSGPGLPTPLTGTCIGLGGHPKYPRPPVSTPPFPTCSIIHHGPYRGCGGPIGAGGHPLRPPTPSVWRCPRYWARTGLVLGSGLGELGQLGNHGDAEAARAQPRRHKPCRISPGWHPPSAAGLGGGHTHSGVPPPAPGGKGVAAVPCL